MNHVVHFSGGITSWGAARRVVDRHGLYSTWLLFADTLIEDNDVYRFLIEAAGDLHGADWMRTSDLRAQALALPPITEMGDRREALRRLSVATMGRLHRVRWIADGRDPWQVFADERFIGNTKVDPCSKILKRELLDRWGRENAQHDIHYVGLDWTEPHRVGGSRPA